jgi:hypothetical protein
MLSENIITNGKNLVRPKKDRKEGRYKLLILEMKREPPLLTP